tara:strand:- start:1055 stop:1741 length:687 start_codon:yes stop_codon:yes gene_type:complete
MKYSKITYKSNIFFKRFTHYSRHIHCSNIVENIKHKTFLDFGTGDGQFFNFLKLKPKKKYFAYEPFKQMYKQFNKDNYNLKDVVLIKNKQKLKKNFYDVITINEVIEHLSDKNIYEVIKIIKFIAKKNSTIIISVPIEIGFSSLIKNLIRIFYNSKHENMTFINIMKSILRKKINRGNKKYYNSHIGFDYFELKKILESNFIIKDISYAPFNILKSFLNSQIFFVCKL